MVTAEYLTDVGQITGWRYLWAKRVVGFDPSNHCARCLVGEYLTPFGLRMPLSTPVEVHPDLKPGDLLYFCGVAVPFKWANNFHFAGRVAPGAPRIVVSAHNGDTIAFEGLDPLPIDAAEARRQYPAKGAAYLTCRNFQFGAQQFPDHGKS